MNTEEKLGLLADASRYDLACACGTKGGPDHRRRGKDGLWLYPVSLPSGGTSIMLKTLLSNVCVNDCLYCPFRTARDVRRCTLQAEDVARLFMDFVRRQGIHGLFLSSGVIRNPDHTMERMSAVARILRKKYAYRGYIHLKIIPGASDAAIDDALSLASSVSLNIEAPTRSAFELIARSKNYDNDIVRPIKQISEKTARGSRYARIRQTTQFIVGASNETDVQIVTAAFRLYRRLRLNRVYFSAYQRGLGDPHLPGEQRTDANPQDILTREHRLYQCDWLIRKYGFSSDEIPFGEDGSLSLERDPKEAWARLHPERFPINANRADREELLRVPGLGLITVERILSARRYHRLRSLSDISGKKKPGKLFTKASGYLTF